MLLESHSLKTVLSHCLLVCVCFGVQLADVKHQLVRVELKSYVPGTDSEKKRSFRLVSSELFKQPAQVVFGFIWILVYFIFSIYSVLLQYLFYNAFFNVWCVFSIVFLFCCVLCFQLLLIFTVCYYSNLVFLLIILIFTEV